MASFHGLHHPLLALLALLALLLLLLYAACHAALAAAGAWAAAAAAAVLLALDTPNGCQWMKDGLQLLVHQAMPQA
jgi:hypothetical protein